MAGLVGDTDLSAWLSPRAARRMSSPSRFAVTAARMAVAESGVDLQRVPGETAVALAVTVGAASACERLLQQIRDEGPTAASPFEFTESVANAPAAQVALAMEARGANLTITQRESGPLLALGRGLAEVGSGRAACALVGSVDEVPPLAHAIFDRYRALARPGDGRTEAARPFDAGRDGFVLAEGATVLILEPEDEARDRGAPILARIRGVFGAHDPTASATDWGIGEEILGGRLFAGLRGCGIPVEGIDRILSGASGSRRGDRLEGRTLRALWPEAGTMPPVLAPKAVTGEYGGGFLAASVIAMASAVGATPGFDEPDPEIGIFPHRHGTLAPPARALVSSLSAGGSAAWAVLESAAELGG